MKERPIIFNAEMVRAVLDGRKTQTRRIVKHKYPQLWRGGYYPSGKVLLDLENQPGAFMEFRHEQQDEAGYTGSKASALVPCPFGQPGDRLWVRETWYQYGHHCMPMWDGADAEDAYWSGQEKAKYAATDEIDNGRACFGDYLWRKRPSIHMPRWASRILLEITDIRVERVQAISEADCIAEGYPGTEVDGKHIPWSPSGWFTAVWQSIYGEDSWDHNGWVWVIEFKRVEA